MDNIQYYYSILQTEVLYDGMLEFRNNEFKNVFGLQLTLFSHGVHMHPEKTAKSWNFIVTFSRT